MFISKKKFEEALANAEMKGAKETEKRMWEELRIDRMEENFCKRISTLEDRIYQLEHPNGEKVEKTILPMR